MLAVFLLLAGFFTWPLAAHFGDQVVTSGVDLDPLHMLYALTWGVHALAQNPMGYFHATFFYPYQASLAFLDHVFGLAVLAAPAIWATGNMLVGYNLVWLGAYLLTRFLTDSVPASFLAGILFAFYPFRYHSGGLINVLAVMWIPFALLSLHLWVETRLRRQLFLFVAFSVAQFLSSTYTAVFLPPAVILYLLVLLLTERKATVELVTRQRWVILAAVGLGIAVVAGFGTPYFHYARAGIGFHRTLPETAPFSAVPWDFLTPAPGSLLRPLAPWAGQGRHPLFFGVVGTLLALYWVLRRGWRGQRHRPELIFYAWLAVAAGLLAFGSGIGAPGHRLPMPFGVAYYVIPGFSFFRDPVRFVVLASLATAVLAGAGLARLAAVHPGFRRRGGAVLLVVLAAVELYAAPVHLLRPLPRHVPSAYAWLGSVGGDPVIVEVPMPADESRERPEHARYQLYSLFHGKRIANGVASFVPPVTRELRRRMQRFPSDDSVAFLRELGVTYVFVHPDLYPPDRREALHEAVLAQPGLDMAEDGGEVWVVEVKPPGVDALY